jgi:hypothetical protein
MGLRFDAIDPQQRPILQGWLAELSGEPASAPRIERRPDFLSRSTDANTALDELVSELMRKGVLAQDMAAGMLKRPVAA